MKRILILASFLTALLLSACKQDRPAYDEGINMPEDSLAAVLTKEIQEDPDNASLFRKRSMRFLEIGDKKRSLEDINTAIRLEPMNPGYQITLSDIYFSMGKARECKSTLESVHTNYPDNLEAVMKLAELAFYFQEYKESAEYLNTAEEIDKAEPRIHFMRGFLAKENGDTLDAVRHFMRTIENDPRHFDANIQLGLLYAIKDDPLAINFYQNALKIRPKSIEALYNLGMFYQDQQELNEAMAVYTEILNIDPGYVHALFNMGYIHVELKVFDEAAMYFNKAVNANPNDHRTYYGRAYCFEQLGDVLNASKDYNKCLELMPEYAPASEGLIRINQGVQPGIPAE